jgi:drug/metabolite transporter (DMT)-like permease
VLAIILALAAAISYGGSDFAAGLASRTASVIQVTLLATVAAAAVVVVALPFAASRPASGAALAWGAAAGAGGTLGAFALYLGFRYAAFSVAGPLSAVGAAGFSVLAGLLLGERPSTLALIGIVLALPAIVGVSASAASAGEAPQAEEAVQAEGAGDARQAEEAAQTEGSGEARQGGKAGEARQAGETGQTGEAEGRGRPAAGVAAGLVAGAGFALLFIGLNRAGSGAGLWPVAAAQVAELAVAVAVAAATRNLRLPGVRPGRLAVITGAAGAAGTILYFFACNDGFLAVTAVLTSLYPAITIVLARTLLGERLTGLRLTGLSLAAVCVALIAAGGAG